MFSQTITTRYASVTVEGTKDVKCEHGHAVTIKRKFEATVNPFNKNADGSVKTYDDVRESLRQRRDEWESQSETIREADCKICQRELKMSKTDYMAQHHALTDADMEFIRESEETLKAAYKSYNELRRQIDSNLQERLRGKYCTMKKIKRDAGRIVEISHVDSYEGNIHYSLDIPNKTDYRKYIDFYDTVYTHQIHVCEK